MIKIRILAILFILSFNFHLFASTTFQLDQKVNFLARDGMKVIKFNFSGDSPRIYHVEFNLNKLYYNVEVITPISPEHAQAITNNSYFILLKSFEATPTPYVGQITKVQDCNSTSKPFISKVQLKNSHLKLVSFISDLSLRPGVCVQKTNAIEVCHSYFFIPTLKSFVKIKSSSNAGAKCMQSTRKFLEEMMF